MISLDSIVVQDREPITATVDDEVVMLSVRSGAYFGFNGVGSEIWNMLSEPRRVGDICAALSSNYEGDEQMLVRDVTAFVQSLIERGLAHVVEESGAEK